MEPDTVIREYAAAWGRGDPEAAFAFYGDDIVMHLPGRGSLAGTHRGRQAVIAAIKLLLVRTDGLPVEVEVLDRLVSGEGVALVLREAATRGDELLELRRVNLYRVTDVKIRAIEIFEANQYEVDEFFGWVARLLSGATDDRRPPWGMSTWPFPRKHRW